MLKIMSLLSTKSLIPIVISVMSLVCAVSYEYGKSTGKKIERLAQNEKTEKMLESHRMQKAKLQQQIDYFSSKYEEALKKKNIVYKTIKEKVAIHDQVNPNSNVLCFSDNILRIVNDSATGTVPETGGKPDDPMRSDPDYSGWAGFSGERLYFDDARPIPSSMLKT